jgi:hypothetical protein
MSSNYAVLGLAMAGAGVLTDVIGARRVLVGAALVTLSAVLVSLVMTRWLPASPEGEDEALGSEAAAAASLLAPAVEAGGPAPGPVLAAARDANDAKPTDGLERIAVLLEEIETTREVEARRTPASTD